MVHRATVNAMNDDLGGLIQRFNTILNGRAASRSLMLMHESGLTFPQIIVLYVLIHEGDQSISRLAAITRLSTPAASQMIDRLLERDYVSRAENADDRRYRVVTLRPKGRRVLERLHRLRHQEIEEALRPLPGGVRRQLHAARADTVGALERAWPARPPQRG